VNFYDHDIPSLPALPFAFGIMRADDERKDRAIGLRFNLRLIFADESPADWERAVNAREVFQLPPLDAPLPPKPREVSQRWAVAPRIFALYMRGHAP
jgi:hypothetical protein